MSFNEKDRREAKLYLLGRLESEPRSEQVEARMMSEPEYYDELLVVEDEVIDQYLSGELSAAEREGFERNFLSTPERVRKLKFARALRDYVSTAAPANERDKEGRGRVSSFFRALFASPVRAAVVTAVVLVGCSLLAWWVYVGSNPEVNRGLSALRAAYRERRPVEARITGLDYAPWYVTRDGSAPAADTTSLDRAERYLLDAEQEHPGPSSQHALGKLYLAEHKYEQAVVMFERALKADERNARLHNDLGVALFEKGKGEDIESLARGVEHFDRAVELDDSLLEARFNRALAYQQMLLPRQAEESWNEYLRRDSNSPWAEEARRNLKLLRESKGATSRNAERALQDFLDARRAGDDDAAWKVVSQSYTSAGNAVTNRLLDGLLGLEPGAQPSEPDANLSALSYLARLESERAGDRHTSDLVTRYERATPKTRALLADARRHANDGLALFRGLEYASAAVEYNSAKLSYTRAGDEASAAFADYLLALSYVFVLELEKARVAFERLSAVCKKRDYRWLNAHCLYRLAHVSADSSEYTKAVDYSSRALEAFEQVGDLDGVLRCLTQLADVNQALNRVERSLGYLRRGLLLSGESRAQPMERWGILTNIAFNLSSLRLRSSALLYQKEALGIALEEGEPLRISRSYGYVGAAYAALKMYTDALGSAKRAFEIGGGLPENTGGLEIMANASLYLGDILRLSGECGKAVEAYDRSIRLYGESNNFEYYRYAAHKGKLLCFIDGPDSQVIGDELGTVLSLFEEYRSKITAESHRDSFFDMEQSVYDLAINYEFARAKDPVKAFEYSEASRARSLLDAMRNGAEVSSKGYGPDIDHRPRGTKPMTLAEVQAGLPEGAQVLQYSVLDDRLLIWVVTKSGVHAEEVNVDARQLSEKARAYIASVSRRPSGDDDGSRARLAEDLYKILLAPAEAYLDKSKFLCVVPDKILNYLPFDALASPATGRYLIEDYDIGVAPSSTIFVDVSASAEGKAGALKERLLSVGDPSFDRAAFPTLPALSSAAREASAVSSFYPSHRVLLRGDAGEQEIKSELERSDVAHLAMHYVVDERSEMLSGFPVASGREGSDGFLQSYEIYRMKLPRTRLVVLSACRTGIEQQYGGEGAVGAARPFMVAGVPIVVASLWSVDSDASAELMVNFHRNRIRESLPVTQALRRAQIEMARGPDARYRNPYYWAPFVAVGGHSRF
jgi:CHAT domain-containing protein/tetratricopeptide (TPR) repeat protein